MLRKKVIALVQQIWAKTTNQALLTVFEKIIFYVLCVCEFFYKIIFSLTCSSKKKKGGKNFPSFFIISVGNLSIGGTGKSVVTQFLVKALAPKKGAIVMRGYRGRVSKTDNSLLVHDGHNFLCDVSECGDEAFMSAQNLQVPVVVGRDRAKSCELLNSKSGSSGQLDFIVLDDAYQNFQVKKDFEILLLDARSPFENGHCLPAGRLREKDFSRADAIILTHADSVSEPDISVIKKLLLHNFDQAKIFTGKHVCKNSMIDAQDENFLIFAGIGSWESFETSVSQLGIATHNKKIYENHYAYKLSDVRDLIAYIEKHNLDGALTTQKDLCKIVPFFKYLTEKEIRYFHVLAIEFEFLSSQEYSNFMLLLQQKVKKI
ncbi:MAG: tetraacyldisaccharide 4'-kinase [bacterium]